jgi:transcriptional regulator with XRE-family HTH domain
MPRSSTTRFADNFDRLLGVHRLTAREAAPLLGVSATTLSYWRNGRREPDRDSLYNISIFFLVDPWDIMEAEPHDFLSRHMADRDRFESVEGQIAERMSVDQLLREAEPEVRRGDELLRALRSAAHAGERRRSADTAIDLTPRLSDRQPAPVEDER